MMMQLQTSKTSRDSLYGLGELENEVGIAINRILGPSGIPPLLRMRLQGLNRDFLLLQVMKVQSGLWPHEDALDSNQDQHAMRP